MKLQYDPVAFVLAHGDTRDRLRLFLALGRLDEARRKQWTREITALQNADGGWPWRMQVGNPSGVTETARTLRLLLRAGLARDSRVVRDALRFLLSGQRADGGWAETPQLAALIPKEWGWISTSYSGWQTPVVVSALLEAGHPQDTDIGRALDFMRQTQDEEGGWPSHVAPEHHYRTDLSVICGTLEAFLQAGESPDSPLVQRSLAAIRANRDRWATPVLNPLDTFVLLGYPPTHPDVQEAMRLLLEKQRPDGGWNWFGDEASSIAAQTVHWIEQLLRCGLEL